MGTGLNDTGNEANDAAAKCQDMAIGGNLIEVEVALGRQQTRNTMAARKGSMGPSPPLDTDWSKQSL